MKSVSAKGRCGVTSSGDEVSLNIALVSDGNESWQEFSHQSPSHSFGPYAAVLCRPSKADVNQSIPFSSLCFTS